MVGVVFRCAFSVRPALGVMLILSGCSKLSGPAPTKPPTSFPVIIETRQSGEQPLAGVTILRGKKELGQSDQTGTLRLELKGVEGNSVALTVRCPEGFGSPEQPITVGLRAMAAGSPEPKFQTECIPLIRTIVVGLRAENGANLPITRLNRTVGRTDDLGVAHLLIQAAPDEQVSLTLDTSSNTTLTPPNPTLTFVARDKDEMVLLEHKFTIKKPVIKRPPKPKGPTRI